MYYSATYENQRHCDLLVFQFENEIETLVRLTRAAVVAKHIDVHQSEETVDNAMPENESEVNKSPL